MVAFVLKTFDWDSFSRGINGKSPELTSALAKQIISLREQDADFLTEMQAKDDELAKYLDKLLARDEWYADLSAEQRINLDRLIALIFDKPVCKIVSVRQVGRVNALLVEFARGNLKVVGTGKQMRFQPTDSAQHDPESELDGIGYRPFRFKHWNPLEAEDVNPFTARKPVHSPSYSIHSPPQAITLLGEVEKVDAESIPDLHSRREFEAELLQPLRIAVKRKLALYVCQDF